MRKIKAIITNGTDLGSWKEEFDIGDNEDANVYMNRIIDRFNNTLRKGESQRTLIGIEEIENGICVQQHQWEKTNLVTIHGRNGMYDTCKCSICGITGRRYGISSFVERDRKYKAKCYDTCTSTLKHLK